MKNITMQWYYALLWQRGKLSCTGAVISKSLVNMGNASRHEPPRHQSSDSKQFDTKLETNKPRDLYNFVSRDLSVVYS